MKLRFISQPHTSGEDLRDFLEHIAGAPDLTKLAIVVAWAKRSGFRVVGPALRAFRDRGGRVEIVVGISEGGATSQGLQLVMDFSDEAFVFHDIRGRTFHPKLYLATGVDRAVALIGSHNLTRGGAVENYEAGILVTADLSDSHDRDFVESIDRYVASLRSDTACCIPLDPAALAAMLADPSLRIGDEDHRRAAAPAAHEESDSVTDDGATISSPFTKSAEPLRTVPAAGRAPGAGATTGPSAAPSPTTPSSAGSAPPVPPIPTGAPRVVRRWFKRLDQANAQRPNPGTNPTGHLSLTQAGHPIAHTRYFRDDFFGSVTWTPGSTRTGAPTEWAEVQFEVIVRGTSLGSERLAVEHRPALIAGQGNRASMLHWGERLLAYFRSNDHVGDVVSVEALSDGSFRIVIDSGPSGPFIA